MVNTSLSHKNDLGHHALTSGLTHQGVNQTWFWDECVCGTLALESPFVNDVTGLLRWRWWFCYVWCGSPLNILRGKREAKLSNSGTWRTHGTGFMEALIAKFARRERQHHVDQYPVIHT